MGPGSAGVSGSDDAGPTGSSTSNTEPWPSVLLARAEPWWASAIACTMARPSPNPPASRVRCGSDLANRWKIRSRSAAGIPDPESDTDRMTCPFSRRAPSSMRSPAAVCAMAFSSSASSASPSRSRSTRTVASAVAVSRHRRGVWPHRSSASTAADSSATGSRCRKSGLPAEASSSIRVASRRSRISSSVTTWASSATSLLVTARSISSACPSATVIGVPSSWEASCRNRRCCLSSRRFSCETRCTSSIAASRSSVAASRRRPCQTITRNISAISGTSAR